MPDPHAGLPVPAPVYVCTGCAAADVGNCKPAEELAWYPGGTDFPPGWYCTDCEHVSALMEDLPGDATPRLDHVLRTRNA